MKKIFRIFAIVSALSAAPWFNAAAAFLIRDGKLQTDLNANTNRLTNATDYVTASGVSVTNLAANLGGGTGTLYRVQSQVTGLGFTTPNGPTAILTGTVATAGSFADTNSVGVIATNAVNQSTNVSARLASNVWAAADSTTNYVRRTGDTMTGTLNGESAASWWPTFRAWDGFPFSGFTDGASVSGMRVHPHPAIGGVGVLTLGAFIPNTVGPIQEFSWAGEIDSVNTVGEFWRLRHVGQDGATQTVMRLVADSALGHSAQIVISNGVFNGDGAGLTNLPVSGASLPAQTAPFALECQHVSDAHGTNLTAFYSSGADALLSLSSVSATNAVNFAGVANQSTATLVTPSFVVWTVKIPELATNFTRLRWRAIDNQATASQPTFAMSWNNGASFAVMTSVVSAASTATSNGYAIAGWTNGFQGRTVQIIGSFTAASTNNLNTRFQGVEASQQSPLWSVE